MTAIEYAKTKSYRKLAIVMENHQLVFRLIPYYDDTVKDFVPNTNKITDEALKQQTVSIGARTIKNENRAKVCKSTAQLCYRGLLYAESSKDSTFKEIVNHSESSLNALPDDKLFNTSRHINSEIAKRKTQLAPVGITELMIDENEERIFLFKGVIDTPQSVVNERSAYTTNIKGWIKENDDILNLLDIGVNLFKDSHPDVYASYKSARKVIVIHKRSMSVRAQILDSITLEGIRGVKVSFTPVANQTILTDEEVKKNTIAKTTAEKGIFNIKSIAEGSYDVVISKSGYKTITSIITIADGDLFELKVNLEKEVQTPANS